MTEWIVPTLLVLALAVLAWQYARLASRVEARAREMHERWRRDDLEALATARAESLSAEWRLSNEREIREDAIRKSEAVIRGKVTEHLIPYFPDFRYNPKDARFMGSPVDFVVFDGLNEGEVKRIVFVEVKTGKTPTLSARERLVRRCIREKRVAYDILHHEGKTSEPASNAVSDAPG